MKRKGTGTSFFGPAGTKRLRDGHTAGIKICRARADDVAVMNIPRTTSDQPERMEHKGKQWLAFILPHVIRTDEKYGCLCFFMPVPALSAVPGRTVGFARGIEKDNTYTDKGLQ